MLVQQNHVGPRSDSNDCCSTLKLLVAQCVLGHEAFVFAVRGDLGYPKLNALPETGAGIAVASSSHLHTRNVSLAWHDLHA